MSSAVAMSRGPVRVDIKRIDGQPAARIPESDDTGNEWVRLHIAGVSRATGPASPAVVYWVITVPDDVPPVYLKRGECVVFGQRISGATVETPPKPFDVDKRYNFALVTSSESGTWIYKGNFCVREKLGGGTRAVLLKEDRRSLPAGTMNRLNDGALIIVSFASALSNCCQVCQHSARSTTCVRGRA